VFFVLLKKKREKKKDHHPGTCFETNPAIVSSISISPFGISDVEHQILAFCFPMTALENILLQVHAL